MISAIFRFLNHYALLWFIAGLTAFGFLALETGWDLKIMAPVAALLSIVVLTLLERLAPWDQKQNGNARETARDYLFLVMNAVMKNLGGALAIFIAVSVAGRTAWLGLPLWLEVFLAVFTAEFGAYWYHRMSHREGWLWRVHSIHHTPNKVNLTNNFLAHPLNVFFLKLARTTPLVLLGFSAEAIFVHAVIVVGVAFAVHANMGGPLGFWNYIIGTPELHRMHHSTRMEEAGNHGTVVPLWDLIFGTHRYNPAGGPAEYGTVNPHRYPRTIPGMLLFPFGYSPKQRTESPAPSRAAAG